MDESFGAGGSPTATMVVDGEEGHHEHNEMRGVANGDVWLGSEAVRKGLADVVMTSDEYLRNLMATGDGLTRPTKAVNAADDDASTTTTTTTKTTTTTTTMATTAVAALPMKKGREIEKAEEEKRKRAKYTERALVLELKKKKEQYDKEILTFEELKKKNRAEFEHRKAERKAAEKELQLRKEQEEKALTSLTSLVSEGKIKYKEDLVEGIELAPEAFIGLLEGKNFGKLLVKTDLQSNH